ARPPTSTNRASQAPTIFQRRLAITRPRRYRDEDTRPPGRAGAGETADRPARDARAVDTRMYRCDTSRRRAVTSTPAEHRAVRAFRPAPSLVGAMTDLFEPLPASAGTRRRENTRAKLVRASLDVFVEKGIDGATVDDLVKAAGFTRGAFYSSFSSKEEVFSALFDEVTDEL